MRQTAHHLEIGRGLPPAASAPASVTFMSNIPVGLNQDVAGAPACRPLRRPSPARRARVAGEWSSSGGQASEILAVGRDHREVSRQAPALAILLGRHAVGSGQVSLKHRDRFAVLQADEILGRCRLTYGHRWLQGIWQRSCRAHAPQRVRGRLDYGRRSLGGFDVVGHLSRRDAGRLAKQLLV